MTGRKAHLRARVGGWVIEYLTKVGREDLLDVVRVEWNSRFTRRMGDATYRPALPGREIVARCRFSIPLWERASEEERRNTVAHELAHLVCFHEWYTKPWHTGRRIRIGELPGRGRKPTAHGWEWKKIMHRMGETPSRCHDVDRTGLVRKHRSRRTVAACCDCKTWMLTPKKAAKMDRLYCPKCKGSLSLEKAA